MVAAPGSIDTISRTGPAHSVGCDESIRCIARVGDSLACSGSCDRSGSPGDPDGIAVSTWADLARGRCARPGGLGLGRQRGWIGDRLGVSGNTCAQLWVYAGAVVGGDWL